MKKFLFLFVSIMLLFSISVYAESIESCYRYLVEEEFDDAKNSTDSSFATERKEGKYSVEIVKDPTQPETTTNKILRWERFDRTSGPRPYVLFPDSIKGNVVVTFRVNQPTDIMNAGTFLVALRDGNTTAGEGSKVLELKLGGGKLTCGSGNAQKTYPRPGWNDFKIEVNQTEGKFNLYMNGSLVMENAKMNKSTYDGLGIGRMVIWVEKEDLGLWYVDDVKLWEDYTEELSEVADALTWEMICNNQRIGEVTSDLELIDSIENDYSITWSSDNTMALTNEGVVKRMSFSQQAILTARITKTIGDDTVFIDKNFEITVVADPEASDQTIIEEYAELYLYEELFTDENVNAITKDLKELPKNINGITVDWTSNNESVITYEGKVTRPHHTEEDTTVTLTALLSYNGVFTEKTLTYTVLKKKDPVAVVQEEYEALLQYNFTSEDVNAITTDISLPLVGSSGATITWDSDNDAISIRGEVTRGTTSVQVEMTALIEYEGESKEAIFYFTVLPTVENMIRLDLESINQTGWDSLTENFTLPLRGSIYGTEFQWESTNTDYLVIDPEDGAVTIYRPLYESGDLSVDLLLEAKNGNVSVQETITVKILKRISDVDAVEAACSQFDFSIISIDELSAIVHNLALPTKLEDGVEIEWSFSEENIVSQKGEITRPLPGEPDTTLWITATFKKNYTERSRSQEITIKAFDTVAEALEVCKDELIFSLLSNEAITEVTSDLTLPSTGEYGSTINWVSNSDYLVVENEVGRVIRPEWGNPHTAKLTAQISIGDFSISKDFYVGILEKDYLQVENNIWYETFDDWSEDEIFTSPTGNWWSVKNNTETGVGIIQDELDENNNVMYLDKRTISNGQGYIIYQSKSSYGSVILAGYKVFVPNENNSFFTLEVRTNGGSQIPITFKDGYARTKSDGNALHMLNATYNKGEWNEIEIVADTNKRKYHFYMNGVLCSGYGDVTTDTGEIFDSTVGIPYNYYSDATRPTALDGFRLSVNGSYIYLDNMYLTQRLIFSDKQLQAATEWDQQFLAANDVNAIYENLVLPNVEVDGLSISYMSSNPNVVSEKGIVIRGTENQNIEFTVVISDGATDYKKIYNLNVLSNGYIAMSDEELVSDDLNKEIEYIKKNNLLSNLTTNLKWNKEGTNGSVISLVSSNTSVLSNDGNVTLGSSNKTITLNVKARKGLVEKTSVMEITIGKKSQSTGSGGSTTSSNTGSGKQVYGTSTIKQTGIDIGNEKEENTSQNNKYPDVNSNHWAFTEIDYMVKNNIMTGVGNGYIEPNRSITREEFLKMLVTVMGYDIEGKESTFTDVDNSAWYAPYVAAAVENGIITGYADNTFGTGELITRQDMAVMISRASNLAATTEADGFADDSDIADYSKSAVYTLKEAGIITGKENNQFAPMSNATRAETACMLYRAIKKEILE